MKNSLTRRIKGVLPPFVGMRTNIIATLLVLPALVLAQSTGVSHEIFVINPTSRVQQTASCILTGNTYYGDGSGLTGITATAETDPIWAGWVVTNGTPVTGNVIRAETDPVFTNWLATNTYVETETDPVWVAQSGPVWAAIGAVTNAGGATIIAIGGGQTATITRASGPEHFINLQTNDGTKTINIAADLLDPSIWSRLLIHFLGTNSPLTITVTNTGTTAGWPVSLTNDSGIIFWDKPQGSMKRWITVFQQYQ